MRVAFEISASKSGHRVRGLGVYTRQLQAALNKLAGLKLLPFVNQPPLSAELVHYPAFTLFTPPPPKPKIPYVVTVHDLIPLQYPQQYPLGIKARLTWLWQKLFLRRAALVITDSLASKQAILRFTHLAAEKIQVIYLAAGTEFKRKSVIIDSSLPEKFVLYVGDVNYNKNLPLLFNVCLENNYPLVLVGKQIIETDFDRRHPENQPLVQLQALLKANQGKIIPLGFVPTQKLVSLYNQATVYVQPSLAEGFGLPVLEAMACGCPVLTSQAGSLPEICAGADLKFTPGNLKRCWQSAELRLKMSQQSLIQAAKFSWEKTASATMKVYEKILNQQ